MPPLASRTADLSEYYFDLGVDGLFTDFADTGVAARAESVNADNGMQCEIEHHQGHRDHHHR